MMQYDVLYLMHHTCAVLITLFVGGMTYIIQCDTVVSTTVV